MDGFEERGEIRIIAATNRFDMLDRAILRPGRFDRLIEVPKPNQEGREIIFEIHTRGMNVADDVEFTELADEADEASGADIKAICTEAGMFAIRDDRTEIRMEDFRSAWEKIQADSDASDEVSRRSPGPSPFSASNRVFAIARPRVASQPSPTPDSSSQRREHEPRDDEQCERQHGENQEVADARSGCGDPRRMIERVAIDCHTNRCAVGRINVPEPERSDRFSDRFTT